ncbi:lytic transglycosylase domain-containing protein [Ditylenchus destructor]|uniref:Lytic transglycosylase domain-containing protein n=1 Tax=Ditylenchus destructor TaxID=166010 RepID=A0AAD4QUA6_9BILA|nr:lytic transglycosylase domain-containing protein [Ditylenchus destructor]
MQLDPLQVFQIQCEVQSKVLCLLCTSRPRLLYNFHNITSQKVLIPNPESSPEMLTKFLTFSLTLLALCHLVLAQEIPYDQEQQGQMSFYVDKGNGACGKPLDASSELLVAVSKEWFANDANPNDDPVCKDVCVKATYGEKSITVPVKDKCEGCPKTKVDMSQEAFKQLGADLNKGVVDIKWQFVKGPCSGAK